MNVKALLKKGAIVAALSVGLSGFALLPGEASAAGKANPHAQRLVDSLQALNLDNVDYLYAYLQSVDLSKAEFDGINANTKRASDILKNKNPESLPNAQKVELARLFLDSVKLAHLQAAFVDDNGNPVDIFTYKPGTTGLVIQLKDMAGNLLATADPTLADLDPKVLLAKINALKSAVQAKEQLENGGKFVPMPEQKLPNTATNNYEYMLLGGLIMLLGAAAAVPAARYFRKTGNTIEA